MLKKRPKWCGDCTGEITSAEWCDICSSYVCDDCNTDHDCLADCLEGEDE
jgi:hypothetical protein